MDFVQIEVTRREKPGTCHNRRMRLAGRVPIVLYGLKKDTLSLSVGEPDLQKFLKTGNRLVELKLAGDTRAAILREVQFDPISDEVLHVDFVRVDKDAEITDTVPVIFKGRAKGTTEGGVFQSLRDHLDVRGRPRDLPREIVVEVDALGVHQSLHAGDAKLPPGVTLVGSPKILLCTVTVVKVEVAAPVAAEGAVEPEVIGKVAAEGEEEAEGAEKGDKKDAKGEKKGDDKAAAKKPDDKGAPKKDEKKK